MDEPVRISSPRPFRRKRNRTSIVLVMLVLSTAIGLSVSAWILYREDRPGAPLQPLAQAIKQFLKTPTKPENIQTPVIPQVIPQPQITQQSVQPNQKVGKPKPVVEASPFASLPPILSLPLRGKSAEYGLIKSEPPASITLELEEVLSVLKAHQRFHLQHPRQTPTQLEWIVDAKSEQSSQEIAKFTLRGELFGFEWLPETDDWHSRLQYFRLRIRTNSTAKTFALFAPPVLPYVTLKFDQKNDTAQKVELQIEKTDLPYQNLRVDLQLSGVATANNASTDNLSLGSKALFKIPSNGLLVGSTNRPIELEVTLGVNPQKQPVFSINAFCDLKTSKESQTFKRTRLSHDNLKAIQDKFSKGIASISVFKQKIPGIKAAIQKDAQSAAIMLESMPEIVQYRGSLLLYAAPQSPEVDAERSILRSQKATLSQQLAELEQLPRILDAKTAEINSYIKSCEELDSRLSEIESSAILHFQAYLSFAGGKVLLGQSAKD